MACNFLQEFTKIAGGEMSELLTQSQAPEAWSVSLREHGVHVSPRLIREKAHRTGNFYKIGRLMLLTPEHLEALIKSSQKATGQ